MHYKPGVCTFCGTGCGHSLRINNNAVEGVFPLQQHPVSKGRLCVRGWNIHELLSSPERISKPLIKENGSFKETSGDDAIARAVNGLMKYKNNGATEIGFMASPRSSNEENFLLMKFARAVCNTNNISLDSEPGHRNSLDVVHQGTGMAGSLASIEEIAQTKFILVVGNDITKQNPIIGSEIHLAANAGATLATIDSRKTQIAKLSHRFLQANPGSYAAILHAMTKTIIDEQLVDADFIAAYTDGYQQFVSSVAGISDADIALHTGIEAGSIKQLARDLAKAKSAMVFVSSGISGLDKETLSGLYNLLLMTGKIGTEASGLHLVTGINNLQGSYDMGISPDLLTGFQKLSDSSAVEKFNKAWGVKLNAQPGKSVYDLFKAKTPPKALVIVEHDEEIIRFADDLKKVEFIVYIGTFTNEIMKYAHVVIPAATYIESDCTFTNTERRVQLSHKKIEPSGALPAWKLLASMAQKAGASWNYQSSADVMAEIAKLTPSYEQITHEKVAAMGGIQWPCDSTAPQGTKRCAIEKMKGKLKFVAQTTRSSAPMTSEEYPSLLIINEAQHYWHQNNLMKKTNIPLREYNATLALYPEGYIGIGPEDAKALQVRDRSRVKVSSAYGAMEAMVMIADELKPKTAAAAYFINDMIKDFFMAHADIMKRGEDATIPVRIVRI